MHLKTLPKNFPANGRQHFPKIASRISGGVNFVTQKPINSLRVAYQNEFCFAVSW